MGRRPSMVSSGRSRMSRFFLQFHRSGKPAALLFHQLADLEKGQGGQHPPGRDARGLHQLLRRQPFLPLQRSEHHQLVLCQRPLLLAGVDDQLWPGNVLLRGSGAGEGVSGFLRRFSAGAGTSSGGRGWGTGIPWVSRVWAVGGARGVFPWSVSGNRARYSSTMSQASWTSLASPGGSGRWGPGSGGHQCPRARRTRLAPPPGPTGR